MCIRDRLFASLSSSFAAANSNTIPYNMTFEQYDVDDILTSNEGWYAEETNALVITYNWPSYTNSYGGILPMPASNHTKILTLNSTATNLFTPLGSGSPTFGKMTYVDMMMKPRRWTLDDPPVVTGDVQMAAYFDSNGVVWAWASTNTMAPPQWLQMDNPPIDTNAWIRFTVSLGYNAGTARARTYQIKIDGVELKNRYGAPNSGTIPPGTGNGSWLGIATSAGRTRRYISSLTLQGTGYFDDMVVTTNTPYFGVTWIITATASNAVIIPSGNVPVVNGNNKTFTITDATGYDVTNVVVWGTGYTNNLGPTNTYTFYNVTTSNHHIHVQSRPENRILIVSSAYGSPSPAGTNIYPYKTTINASVAGSPVAHGISTQFICTGWTRTTSSPGSGSSTSTTFQITGTSTSAITTLTWNWAMRHKLTVTISGNGVVSNMPAGPWYYTNETVSLTAYGQNGSIFTGWSGETNGAIINTNQLIFTNMATPRYVTANFVGGVTHTPKGTPYVWIQHYYGVTNYDAVDLLDLDGDGLLTWEEYIAGTDPTDSNSVFQVLSIGMQNGSNFVKFYGGLTSAPDSLLLPFGMSRTTNMLYNFQLIPSRQIPRAGTGTNWFWEATPSETKYFYRPVATNSP